MDESDKGMKKDDGWKWEGHEKDDGWKWEGREKGWLMKVRRMKIKYNITYSHYIKYYIMTANVSYKIDLVHVICIHNVCYMFIKAEVIWMKV